MKQINKQKGFSILAVILVIVAVIVAIGIWALSGQTNTTNSGNSADNIQATSIINDGAAIKLEFDKLLVNGANPTSVVFMPGTASTASAPNILDPVNGLQYPKANLKALRDGVTEPEGIWVYRPNLNQPGGVGSSITTPTNAILLTGIKDTVCQRINFNLYGDTNVPIRSGAVVPTTYVTGATSSNPNTTSNIAMFTGPASVTTAGWTSGCIKPNATSIDSSIYFKLLMVK